MRKVPALFARDPDDLRRTTRDVPPNCQWVLDGEGVPTRKFNGMCVKLDSDGAWWSRREVKPGKQTPENFDPEEHDEATGKTFGWEPIEQSAFAEFHAEAVPDCEAMQAGTYELCGPKINANPEGFSGHTLVPHGSEPLHGAPRDFDGLRDWLLGCSYEGVVWHHPDGRMAKVKRRDFLRLANRPFRNWQSDGRHEP